MLIYNVLRGGRIERVIVCPINIVLDGTLMAQSWITLFHRVSCRREHETPSHEYIPINFATCKHVETALSKKDRMRANKRRNIRSRSLLETRGEIDHAIVDFARSSKLTRRSPRIRRRTNSSLFLKLIEYSKLKFEWFSRRQCFVLNDWKMLTVSKQTPQSLSRPLSLVRVRLVFSFEPCLLISKRCVWLVHLARSTHASLDSRVKIAEDRDDGDDEQDNE